MYQPQIETASREVLQAMQLRLLQNQLSYVYEHSPMYRRKYDEVGLEPGDIKTLSDISKIPFTTKEDLRKSQEENPLLVIFYVFLRTKEYGSLRPLAQQENH